MTGVSSSLHFSYSQYLHILFFLILFLPVSVVWNFLRKNKLFKNYKYNPHGRHTQDIVI